MSPTPTAPEPDDQRDSHPGAAGDEGLAGDLGISSERSDGFTGVEGTGTSASAQGRTDGVEPAVPADEDDETSDQGGVDKPDATSPVTHVDRTVGEVQPDPVANKHAFDPDRNPRH